jgi:hypothetical protein
MAETVLREDCGTWLALVMRMNSSRQQHAVTAREKRRRRCKEHWLELWAYRIAVRHMIAICRLDIDRSWMRGSRSVAMSGSC